MCDRENFRMEEEDDINMEMGDSDGEIDDDDVDDEDDEEGMDDDGEEAAPPPEPVEEDAAIARRRAIQRIMADKSLSEQDKRFAMQQLMSQNRLEVIPTPAPVIPVPEANAACVHYERNCNIVAPLSGRVFGCHICHDELSGQPPMDRFKIREIVCKNCNTRQGASNQCVNCQTIFGEYHCPICNIWMSQVRKTLHSRS